MLVAALLCAVAASCALASNPWDQYILAPASRLIAPRLQFDSVTRARTPISLPLHVSPGAAVIVDFEREVGGFVSLRTGDCETANLLLSFSESTYYT